MIRHFPLVAAFVDALKEVPLSVHTFDTEVRAVEVADLARGNIKGGGGTDFNAPVRDLLDDRDLSAGVLFTDGEGLLSSELGRRLKQSGKRLYIVYLGATKPDISLHRFATDTITVPSA